ncbi:MAG: flagellar biosynthesis protein FliQ [Phycisphaerales bacterium]|nr:flagellar biosynthesis protein FliQ [Phycisphaerales bacterium]
MELNQAVDLGREALVLTMIIAAPIMGIGLIVGLTVSMFQSMTQLHEQTLSFVPKIVSMVAITLLLVPWIAERLLEYTRSMLGSMPF